MKVEPYPSFQVKLMCVVAVGLSIACAQAVEATVVEFDVANVGGITWEYSYTVTNDTLGVDIDDFIVLFDYTLFTNLHLPTAPADWDPLVIQPDLLLPDDGFFDVLALSAGIAPGASVTGFTVRADFLGAGSPGAQAFETYDSNFDLLDDGVTVPSGKAPEPSSTALLLAGFASVMTWRRRYRRSD